MKKKLELPNIQVACLNSDVFKSQSTEKVKLELEHLNIKDVKVPKHMIHLLEQSEFSVTICLTKALLTDPKQDVTKLKRFQKYNNGTCKEDTREFNNFWSELIVMRSLIKLC